MSFHVRFSRELATQKVHDLFSEEQWDDVFRALKFEDVHPDPVGQAAQARIQLAVLKLSEGNLSRLEEFARMADVDYRDVLTLAEYPSIIRDDRIDMTQENKEEDRKQYLDWLNNPPRP